jgi:hypothetical protein
MAIIHLDGDMQHSSLLSEDELTPPDITSTLVGGCDLVRAQPGPISDHGKGEPNTSLSASWTPVELDLISVPPRVGFDPPLRFFSI